MTQVDQYHVVLNSKGQ